MILFMSTGKGAPARNQKVWYTRHGLYLQSYNSIVAYRSHDGNIGYLGEHWDYSNTTKRYVELFFAGMARPGAIVATLGTDMSKEPLDERADGSRA